MRKPPEDITMDELIAMLKDAKIIKSSLEVGMDRHGTISHNGRVVGFQYSGKLYSRREVARFIGDSRFVE